MSRYFSALWNVLIIYMDNSVFFRAINSIMEFFKNLFGGSIIAKFASTRTNEENLRASFTYRFVDSIPQFLYKMRDSFFAKAFESSGAVAGVKILPQLCFSLKVRDISIGILAMMANYSLLRGAVTFNTFSALCISVGIITLVIGMLTPADVYGLVEGSFIYKLISRYFGVSLPEQEKNEAFKLGWLFCSAIGLYASMLVVKLPLLYAAAGIALPVCVLLAIAYPYLGLLGVAAAVPFAPTMLLAGMVIGVGLCFVLKLLTNRGCSFKLDIMGVAVFLYIAINIWKGITSLDMGSSIRIVLLITAFMAVYFIFVSLVDTGEKLHVIVFMIATSSAFVGLYGLYQKLSGKIDITWVDKNQVKDVSLRVYSTLGNPNVYGAYLLIAIPLCLVAAYMSKKILLKLYYAGISTLLLLNLGLTYSRGCYLALAFGVVVFILFIEKRLVAILPAGLFLIPIVLPTSMLNRIFSITNLSDSSTTYRISIWQATVRMLKDFWISGVGQGIDAYNMAYPLYGFNAVSAPHSHNLFLQVFVETGIFGLLTFLALLLCFFKTLVPFLKQTHEMRHKVFAAGMMGMLTALMLQAMFDYIFYNYKIFLLFFIIIALCSAYVRIYGSGREGVGHD